MAPRRSRRARRPPGDLAAPGSRNTHEGGQTETESRKAGQDGTGQSHDDDGGRNVRPQESTSLDSNS